MLWREFVIILIWVANACISFVAQLEPISLSANLTCAFWDFFELLFGAQSPAKPLFYSIVISKMAIISLICPGFLLPFVEWTKIVSQAQNIAQFLTVQTLDSFRQLSTVNSPGTQFGLFYAQKRLGLLTTKLSNLDCNNELQRWIRKADGMCSNLTLFGLISRADAPCTLDFRTVQVPPI
jgi:hypothetical protein